MEESANTAATAGPTRGGERFAGVQRWPARRAAARIVRVSAFLIPLVLAVAAAWTVGAHVPATSGAAVVMRWLAMCAIATGILLLTERLTRRLLPVASLLELSLAFPDRAPSRFSVALRASSTKQLEPRLKPTPGADTSIDTADAAAKILTQVASLSRHDRRTRGHSERVRAYAVLIGEELGLRGDELDKLQWSALLHDIGKLDVPADILNKDGRPTDDEWATLAEHPASGEHMIEPLLPWLGEWGRATAEHHERWDGNGYPNRLSANDIALSARIVAVADSFEVMTAARSYKAPLSVEAARREVIACSGKQFDPTVVRAFVAISLGRLNRALGPIAWLLQLPFVPPAAAASVPAAAAVGGAIATAALLVPTLALPPLTADQAAAAPGGVEQVVDVDADEDDSEEAGTGSEASNNQPGTLPSASSNSNPSSASATAQGATGSNSVAGARGTGTNQPTSPGVLGNPTDIGVPSLPPTPPVTGPLVLYLGSNGLFNVSSSSVLPLTSQGPTIGTLFNLDINRDAFPGLMIQKTNHGLGETDLTKRQLWSQAIGGTHVQGAARVHVWAGLKDFKTDKRAHLLLAVQSCSSPTSGCTTLASTTALVDGTTGPGWKSVDANLGFVDHTVPAGHHLVVRIQVEDYSDDDCWLAFGTTSFPASLTIG